MYYTVIKHSGHLRTLEKCRKHSPAARVVYISFVFSNARRVLSQCKTRLRLLYLLNNPPNNFCVLSLDKTDHVIQNQTMVIRGSPPSDLISVVCFYFDGRKTKKQANVRAKLLIGQEKPKETFSRSL